MLTIVNTGQPGVEQGALRAAIDLGLQTGGWCSVEHGLPAIYASPMLVTSSTDHGMVRRLCVQDSDGTLAFSFGVVALGVVAWTERVAESMGRAWMHLCLPAGAEDSLPDAVIAEVRDWVAEETIETLHVTGTGEDDAPGIQELVRRELTKILEPIAAAQLQEFARVNMKLLGDLIDLPQGDP